MSIEIIVLRFAYYKAKTPFSVVPFSIILPVEFSIIIYILVRSNRKFSTAEVVLDFVDKFHNS